MKNLTESNVYTPLSAEDKKMLKLDVASFTKRMKDRIKKIQGDESANDVSENFLLRHRYGEANSL